MYHDACSMTAYLRSVILVGVLTCASSITGLVGLVDVGNFEASARTMRLRGPQARGCDESTHQ